MPRGQRTHPAKAAHILALGETGEIGTKIAKLVGVEPRTVHDILAGNGAWAPERIADDTLFSAIRSEAKRSLQAAMIALSRKSLEQAEATLPRASYLQAVTGVGILTDKERLLAGESSVNISVASRGEVADLDQLAQKLSRALVKRKSK